MKRVYLSPVVGTGASHLDAQRLKVRDLLSPGSSCVTVIQTAANGVVARAWGLALVEGDAAQHTLINNDAEIRQLPVIPLTQALTAPQRTAIENWLLGKAEVDVTIPVGWTLRQCIDWLGKRLNPNFDQDEERCG